MEDFREYWERFVEWFWEFIKSRWINVIILSILWIVSIVAMVFSIMGCVVSQPYHNDINNWTEIYGHIEWAIPGVLLSILSWILITLLLINYPNNHEYKASKLYRAWKLWYWLPSLLSLLLLEYLLKLFIKMLYGRYSKNVIPLTKFTKKKLWYWILTLGIGYLIELLNANVAKWVKDNHLYWDLVTISFALLICGMILGILAFETRLTSIRIVTK